MFEDHYFKLNHLYLKDDLNKLHELSVKWKMDFNPDPNKPAEEVIFTNRNSTSYDTLSFWGMDVKTVDFHKHLGFVLYSQMNTIKHVDRKIAKANQGMGVINRLCNYMQRKALLPDLQIFYTPASGLL